VRSYGREAEKGQNQPEANPVLPEKSVTPVRRRVKLDKTRDSFSEQASAGTFTLDRQGRILDLNDAGANLLGFPATWLVGRAFVVFVARQDVPQFLSMLRESRKTAGPRRRAVDLYRGVYTLPVQVSIITTVESEILHHLSVVDLSGARTDLLQQDSLANSYSLLHNAPDTILTVTRHGMITFVNKPMWGYSAHALLNTNLLDHVAKTEHHKILDCLSQSFRFNKRSMCDIAESHEDNARWFNLSFGTPHARIGINADQSITTTLVVREISQDKRREETLRASGEHFRDFATRVEAVREEERARVAREIHDELGQALTALKLEMAWVQTKAGRNAEIRKRMKSMIADVDSTIEKVREISSELRPSILDDLGLIAAMEWLLSKFRKRSKIRTVFTHSEENLILSPEASAALFRVLQEALTNVIRHAKATKVDVRLDRLGNALRVTISDNGQGMTDKREVDLKSLGIIGMKERIARLDGQFKIFSEPGNGTRLDITIPIQK